jgi:hypothetical protein
MSANGAPERGDYTLVRYFDGTEQLALARVGDLVAFETQHGRPIDTGRMTDVLWTVWRALGEPEGELQAWADKVASFASDPKTVAEARERLDPTGPQTAAAGEARSPA